MYVRDFSDSTDRAVKGVDLCPFAFWGCGFENPATSTDECMLTDTCRRAVKTQLKL